MVQAISFDVPGDIKVLKMINLDIAPPKPDEVTIKNTACEVNFIDIYHRKGIYNLNSNPKILGISGVGYIERIGSNIDGFKEGDKVGYISQNGGAYSQKININQKHVFTIPQEIKDTIAAASIVKGLTAHYLANRTFVVKKGVAVLIHAAAGGVGQLLAQWCNINGALVLGTVGSEEKKAIARSSGCHKVINYQSEDWVAQVMKHTENLGVNCVYDAVGKATFEGSLKCLMKIGILVSYGAASGEITSIDPGKLAEKSLFFTKPTLFDYKDNRMELVLSAAELFNMISSNKLIVQDPTVLPLNQVMQAHNMLESRKTTGSIVLVP